MQRIRKSMSGSGGNPNKLTVKQIEKRSTKQTGYWVKGQTEKRSNRKTGKWTKYFS